MSPTASSLSHQNLMCTLSDWNLVGFWGSGLLSTCICIIFSPSDQPRETESAAFDISGQNVTLQISNPVVSMRTSKSHHACFHEHSLWFLGCPYWPSLWIVVWRSDIKYITTDQRPCAVSVSQPALASVRSIGPARLQTYVPRLCLHWEIH